MRLVIADTGPINYLILIEQIGLLPLLFARVAIPTAVQLELRNPAAPAVVKSWISSPPTWLEVFEDQKVDASIQALHNGEAAAIMLAEALQADLLLIDDRQGCRVALQRGLQVTGTLGLLDFAAERGLIDFSTAIEKLETTSFRRPLSILQALRLKHKSQ